MLVRIPEVLTAEEVRAMCAKLDAAGDAWVDGRVTAGHQGARVKDNLQLAEDSPLARELGERVLAALGRSALFVSAALPNRVYPPLFNRYRGNMHFGNHIDGAVRIPPGGGARIRTDVSATLFLTPPEEYDGGELVVEDTYGAHAVKFAAGDMVVYPGSSLHRVTPVTRGTRTGCFFWVQSLVRSDEQRALLFDMDNAIRRLTAVNPEEPSLVYLAGCYHNLLRMWSDT